MTAPSLPEIDGQSTRPASHTRHAAGAHSVKALPVRLIIAVGARARRTAHARLLHGRAVVLAQHLRPDHDVRGAPLPAHEPHVFAEGAHLTGVQLQRVAARARARGVPARPDHDVAARRLLDLRNGMAASGRRRKREHVP